MSTEELNNNLEKAKKDAVGALENFLNNLDINPKLLQHIYDVEMVFVEKEVKGVSYPNYNPVTNIIELSPNDFTKSINAIKNVGMDSEKGRKIYGDLVASLLHEMLHANRALMIEGGVNAKNIDDKYDDDVSKSIAVSQGHDIVKYEELLFKMMDDEYIDSFTQYIPIKAKRFEDGVTVIAYNKSEKSFVEFTKQKFNETFNGDPHDYLVDIGLELNSIAGKMFHKPTRTIYAYPEEKQNNDDMVADASDFYHDYKPNETDILDAADHIDHQQDFEEIIVETLSYMIYMSRNKSYIDLEELSSKIIDSNDSDLDIKVGAYLINKCGLDLLNWYMLSTYDFSYTDYFKKTFKEEYDDLLENMSILYEPNEYSKEEKNKAKQEVYDIISRNEELKR